MSGRDIVVVGTSIGGVEALRTLVGGLPADFAGSLFVVMHTSPDSPGVLAGILDRAGPLPAQSAANRERIRPGHVYVAPPDQHLLLEPGLMRLTRGPKENRFRPAVDPLFRSAAQVYGPRVVGVILTGGLDDGTSGLWAVKRLGGLTIVQDPDEAFMPSMPLNALSQVEVDYTLSLAEIPPLLARLASHTGHAYAADSLLADLTDNVEKTLWSAIRSMAESVMLMRHMAEHVRESDRGAAERFLEKANEAERRSELVRQAVFDHENLSEENLANTAATAGD